MRKIEVYVTTHDLPDPNYWFFLFDLFIELFALVNEILLNRYVECRFAYKSTIPIVHC